MARIMQVLKYGWKHAAEVEDASRVRVFGDIVFCYMKYGMWSNQYLELGMWTLDAQRRAEVGAVVAKKNRERALWQRDFRQNKRFLNRFMSTKYELAHLRARRARAYQRRYNMGDNPMVEHGVEISRQHYLPGTIKMGDNVLLAKNCFIDYSGHVVIGSDVQITDGVHILSHDHRHHHVPGFARDFADNDVQGSLEIGDGAVLGTRSVVMPSCRRIGCFARVGAGAVVTKDVPDYAVAVGVPARVIKTCIPGNANEWCQS